MANENLSGDFVIELIHTTLNRRTIMDIVRQHLKFSYLQNEPEKKLWQYITKQYDKTGVIPSMGSLQQFFISDENVIDLLEKIKDIEIDETSYESIIDTFEAFIKQMKFLDANDKIVDSYNRGKKDESFALMMKYAEEISHFSIKSAKFERVFADFAMRQIRRKSDDYNFRFKIPTTIDEFDYRLGGSSGGPETGEYCLWLADSGVGKSQLAVYIGISGARQGFRVVHFQLEGTREQCLNRYDSAWTGTLYQDMKVGNISSKKLEISQRVIKKLCRHDIHISADESFSGKTLTEARNELKEIERAYGKVDLIIFDYLELLELGDGHNYTPSEERHRQSKLSQGMKKLAIEFNAVVHAFTQASNIGFERKNDPEFIITRDQLSEDKGKLKPADIFSTLNQTHDEYKESMMRIHTDKLRDHRNGAPITICNNFDYARFYDRKRTLDLEIMD